MSDKISESDKSTIENAIAKVKTALSGTDIAAIKSATDDLQKEFYAVSERLYSQANQQSGYDPNAGGSPGGGPDAGGEAPGRGEYYDADYEVVDDDKK
jgi:molecular chaperone DnaK